MIEIRARNARYLIDAVDEDAAKRGIGDFIDEGGDADDYTLEILSVEQVSDEQDCA